MDSPHIDLPLPVCKAMRQLLDCVPPNKLRRTMRCLLLEYLSEHCHDLPPELEQVAEEFNSVFRFLETADAHTKPPG